MNLNVLFDLVVITTVLVVLSVELWRIFVKHQKVPFDVFFLGPVIMAFAAFDLLTELKVLSSEVVLIIYFLLFGSLFVYGIYFFYFRRRTARNKL